MHLRMRKTLLFLGALPNGGEFLTDIKKHEPLWGSWYIDSLIGEGAFGKVYKIRKTEFGETYYSALKVIPIPLNDGDQKSVRADMPDDAAVRNYFLSIVGDILREVNIMCSFKGTTNIVSFDDHSVIERESEFGWDILIRMELLTSLPKYSEDKKLACHEVVKLGIDICRALEVCAKKNVIHRDIKPDNIFVSDFKDFKLGDFGVARQVEKTMFCSIKGTYNYIAPEIYNGREYGANADLYSLGVMLYRILNNNRMPFLSETYVSHEREEALRRRMNGEPLPPISGISRELNDVILKATMSDRALRYQNAIDMRFALEKIADGLDADKTMAMFAAEHEAEPAPELFNADPDADVITDTDGLSGKAEESSEFEDKKGLDDKEDAREKSAVTKKLPMIFGGAAIALIIMGLIGVSSVYKLWGSPPSYSTYSTTAGVKTENPTAAAIQIPTPELLTEPAPSENELGTEAPSVVRAAGLSDELSSFQIQLNGVIYTLPMPYSEFVANGWRFEDFDDDELKPGELKPEEEYYGRVFSDHQQEILVDLINLTEDIQALDNCYVYRIDVSSEDIDSLIMPKGVTFGTSKDDVLALYGKLTTNNFEFGRSLRYKFVDFGFSSIDLTFDEDAPDAHLKRIIISNDFIPVNASGYTYKSPSVLGNSWDEFNVKVNGDLYHIPAPVSEFIANGWTIDDADLSIAGYRSYELVYLEKGSQTLAVNLTNYSDKKQNGKFCFVTEIKNFQEDDLPLEMELANGITRESSFDEVVAAFGRPTEITESTYGLFCIYRRSDNHFQEMYITLFNDTSKKNNFTICNELFLLN
jgi:serine/threonine protein kinase